MKGEPGQNEKLTFKLLHTSVVLENKVFWSTEKLECAGLARAGG